MGVFDGVAEELFKRQVKYKKGRHWLEVPFQKSERMHWLGSKHTAYLNYYLHEKFGTDVFVETYRASKLYGHTFGARITSLVKTQRLIAPMMTLLVKEFGWGEIEAIRTKYKDDWLTFNFHDLPDSREISKAFGFQKVPFDYMTAGLIAGSAEQLLERKFVVMETECVAKGDSRCVFETLSIENFKKKLDSITDSNYLTILKKILELEEKTDFFKETEKVKKSQNKKAQLSEQTYLKKEHIH